MNLLLDKLANADRWSAGLQPALGVRVRKADFKSARRHPVE